MNAILTRLKTGDSGTFGRLVLEDGSSYMTGELPWRDNAPQRSCIPAGTYPCQIYQSPTHGAVYTVTKVPNRSYIEIHAANWFGDRDKGFQAQMLGCIGLGRVLGKLIGQDALLSSAVAVQEFMQKQGGKPFTLTIIGV